MHFSSGSADDTAGDDNPGPELPGHRVTCCFSGTFRYPGGGHHQHYGCQSNDFVKECINPDTYSTTPQGLESFCGKKCQGHPWSNSVPVPLWTWSGTAPPSDADMLGCVAIPAGTALESHIEPDDYNDCNPFEPKSYGELFDVPPMFETDFASSSQQNELEVWITGEEAAVGSWTLTMAYSIDMCEPDGSDFLCRVLISGLELSLGAFSVGDYRMTDAVLALNQSVAANVVLTPFGPGPGFYTGTFELSETEGNAIGTNLFWTQVNTQTLSEDEGALHLTNGPGGLGGVDEILGIIELTPSGGTLRLIGYGQDAFGGEWASVDFDIRGPLGSPRG